MAVKFSAGRMEAVRAVFFKAVAHVTGGNESEFLVNKLGGEFLALVKMFPRRGKGGEESVNGQGLG